MPQRPEPLQRGKQFESFGSTFGPPKVDLSRLSQGSRGTETRRDKKSGSSGSRVGLSRTSSSRSAFSMARPDSDSDESDDELDCLSKRSSSPVAPSPPEPSEYLKKIEKTSNGLKGLKFKKMSKSGPGSGSAAPTPSQHSSQPTSTASSTPATHKENVSRPKTSPPRPAVPRTKEADSEADRTERGSRRKAPPVSQPLKIKEPNNKKVSEPKPTRKTRDTSPVDDPPKPERPRPRRLQKSTAKPIEPKRTPSPIPVQSSTSPSRLTRKPSKFPMDDVTPIAKGKQKQPLARKPSSFPVMSPLSDNRSTSKSMTSIPPLSSPPPDDEVSIVSRGSKKRGKTKKQVVESRGTHQILVTDEGSSCDEGGGTKLQPFPMSTQDMESINRCPSPGPSNLGKRISPGNLTAGKSKKRRDLSPETSFPSFTQRDAEMDHLFPCNHADPKTLCPYCDMPLPSSPTPLLQYLLSPDYTPLYSKSDPDPRPGNRLGRTAPLSAFISVCQRHRFESEMLPEAERKRWPKEIDWQALASRVTNMKHIVQELILDTPGVVDGPREQCVFWTEVVKEYREKGSRAVTGVRGQFENFEKTQPGYYGEQGSNIIHQALYSLFPPSSIDPASVTPLAPNEFISRVLVPEVAVALIMEDRRLKGDKGKAEAVKILRESAAYGVAMFPEDGGDWAQAERSRLSSRGKGKGKATRKKTGPSEGNDFEIGVADKIVMERARKRRMEVEEEMRMEDDLLCQQREEADTRTDDEPMTEREGRAAARKPVDSDSEEVMIVQDDRMECDNTVRPKRRPKPIPIGRKPSQQIPSSSLNRHGDETDTSEVLSASESTSAQPKTTRRKKFQRPTARSPVISDFETSNNNEQCSMDWALPADDFFSNMNSDTMDLVSDASEKAGSIRSKRGSRVSKSRSVTPSVDHPRASRSRSRAAKEKERDDNTDDLSIMEISTPRALPSKTNRWEDDNGDTPRPSKITLTTSSTPLASSSNSVWDMLKQRNQEVGDTLEPLVPSSSNADGLWTKTMAADVLDDDCGSSSSVGRQYRGRPAPSRQGKKKASPDSWLLSDESQEGV
ncbi:hypothetical protein EYR40_008811 [Pleurotus pulmonarius]|nr:hypothetical protein EYR36_009632 [Pleurotus pulmonarius]KAF4594013.1 hypothetical protein EYR40_008811 [Pleurotus pulmonarius]